MMYDAAERSSPLSEMAQDGYESAALRLIRLSHAHSRITMFSSYVSSSSSR